MQALRQPIDWATLYLAYLNQRYEPQIWQLVLTDELERDEIENIVEQLKTLVFVRQSISPQGGGSARNWVMSLDYRDGFGWLGGLKLAIWWA